MSDTKPHIETDGGPAAIPDSAIELCKKLDEAEARKAGFCVSATLDLLVLLFDGKMVEVGWRECCGTTDPSVRRHKNWIKVVRHVRKLGYQVQEEKQKHGNSWATKAGGFWSSVIYTLAARRAEGGGK